MGNYVKYSFYKEDGRPVTLKNINLFEGRTLCRFEPKAGNRVDRTISYMYSRGAHGVYFSELNYTFPCMQISPLLCNDEPAYSNIYPKFTDRIRRCYLINARFTVDEKRLAMPRHNDFCMFDVRSDFEIIESMDGDIYVRSYSKDRELKSLDNEKYPFDMYSYRKLFSSFPILSLIDKHIPESLPSRLGTTMEISGIRTPEIVISSAGAASGSSPVSCEPTYCGTAIEMTTALSMLITPDTSADTGTQTDHIPFFSRPIINITNINVTNVIAPQIINNYYKISPPGGANMFSGAHGSVFNPVFNGATGNVISRDAFGNIKGKATGSVSLAGSTGAIEKVGSVLSTLAGLPK